MSAAARRARPALAFAFLLAACGEGSGGTSMAPDPANAGVPAAEAPAPAPAANAATDARNLAVDSEGLRLVDATSGAARLLPFGMAQDQLLALLEAFHGPADRGTNAECGAGPLDYAVWADGLTLHFQDDLFAGWALDARAEGAHSTMSGIGPGSTRAELEAAYDVTVEQTTLGTEFGAGGLSGILDGDGPDARIGPMWAGSSCVFR